MKHHILVSNRIEQSLRYQINTNGLRVPNNRKRGCIFEKACHRRRAAHLPLLHLAKKCSCPATLLDNWFEAFMVAIAVESLGRV